MEESKEKELPSMDKVRALHARHNASGTSYIRIRRTRMLEMEKNMKFKGSSYRLRRNFTKQLSCSWRVQTGRMIRWSISRTPLSIE